MFGPVIKNQKISVNSQKISFFINQTKEKHTQKKTFLMKIKNRKVSDI